MVCAGSSFLGVEDSAGGVLISNLTSYTAGMIDLVKASSLSSGDETLTCTLLVLPRTTLFTYDAQPAVGWNSQSHGGWLTHWSPSLSVWVGVRH